MGDDRKSLSMVLRLAGLERAATVDELLARLDNLPVEVRCDLGRCSAAYAFPELVTRLSNDRAANVRIAVARNAKVVEHPSVALGSVRAAAEARDVDLLRAWAAQPRVVELPEALSHLLAERSSAAVLASKANFARNAPAAFVAVFLKSRECGWDEVTAGVLANPRVFEFPEVVSAAVRSDELSGLLLANRHLRDYPTVVVELAQLPRLRRDIAAIPWIEGVPRAIDSIISSHDLMAIETLLAEGTSNETITKILDFATNKAPETEGMGLIERALRHVSAFPERLRACLDPRSEQRRECAPLQAAAREWVSRKASVLPNGEPANWLLAVLPFLQSPIPDEFQEAVIEACAGLRFEFAPEPVMPAENLGLLVRLQGDATFRRAVFSCCLNSDCEPHVLASAAISLSRIVETNHRELLARLNSARPDFADSPLGSIILAAIGRGEAVPA